MSLPLTDSLTDSEESARLDGVGWNGRCLLTIVRFMQQRDCIEEGIVLRLRLPLT